jgi:hypothetical protein
MKCFPLWPRYIYVRRGGLSAKHMGLKRGAIKNTLGEHIGNPGNILRTCREHRRNMLGTKEKWKKSSLPPSPKNLKEKKSRHLEFMQQPTHWLHEISIFKTVHHHFWPGLTAGSVNWGHRVDHHTNDQALKS